MQESSDALSMTDSDAGHLHLAIIGAGPAGLSAAARAVQIDARAGRSRPSYVLLEGTPRIANTIQRYQRGKPVMAEPGYLDLRSDLEFGKSTREGVLGKWDRDIARLQVHVRYQAEVKKVSGQQGCFRLQLADGSELVAAHIVLAIGVAGNPVRLAVPGADLEQVEYQLDDPKAFRNQKILIVGGGDAAIENAMALSEQNDVVIAYRKNEFARLKPENLAGLARASGDPRTRLSVLLQTVTRSIKPGTERALAVTLQTPTGDREMEYDRVIARLGGVAPRTFVESMGILFPGSQPEAVPALSRRYESNVPGIYIVGSLAGYPLIKQAMNQGYDVAEFVYGNDVKPADYPLVQAQLCGLPFDREAEELLDRLKSLVPMFSELNALAFRELIIESEVIASYAEGSDLREAQAKMAAAGHRPSAQRSAPAPDGRGSPGEVRVTHLMREGDVIYDEGEFGTSFYTIAFGEVTLHTREPVARKTQLQRGEFFGELSLMSGRPRAERAVAGPGCILVETPRRTMLKLISSNQSVRDGINWIFVVRELQRHFAPRTDARQLREIAGRIGVRSFKAGESIFKEGETAESVFAVLSGSVTLTRRHQQSDLFVAQVQAGNLIGELSLTADPLRRESALASVACELIEVRRAEFRAMLSLDDSSIKSFQRGVSEHVSQSARMQARPEAGSILNFLMAEGLGEATNVLVIDESLCIGCDNCEKACAETHAGISRLDRKAGASFARLHVPVACRHCEQPHCMKDCPPNALKRTVDGRVFIDDTCIGCGNCQANCPYGVIRMSYDAPRKPGLLSWLLFGSGPGMGEEPDYHPTEMAKQKGKKATKCDACAGLPHGPACVRSCPTGAAQRVGPQRFLELADQREK
jgi:Fe-S-cluster-containing hydrogenase component 2/thioredoxin reductase/CRP-like cAMP-binding protein